MKKHIDERRLNDYLDGLSSEEETREVGEHLATCEECSRRRESLEGLLAELAELPREANPERDLWSDIRSRMDGNGAALEDADDKIVALPVQRRAGSRRVSFSVGQLMAASIALAVISGGTVWMAINAGPTGVDAGASVALVSQSGSMVPAIQAATTEYEQAIASLESVLAQGRGLLDPETLATIEQSLRLIDQAIGEARQALAEDPNNDLLNRLLIKNQQSKLRVLRQASSALQI